MKTCLPKHTWNLCMPFFFFGGKIQKMLVLNSKERRKVPDWLFPECDILGLLSSFTGCVMTSSGPARRAPQTRAPQTQAPQGWKSQSAAGTLCTAMGSLTVPLSTATLLPQCRSELLNFSLFTEILIVVIGVIWTSMTRMEDLSIIQTDSSREKACSWWRGPHPTHHQTVRLT